MAMKNKAKKRQRSNQSPRRGAESIMRGIAEIEAMIRDGSRPEERFTVRTIQTTDEPKEYGPSDVRRLRDRLNISQPLFAELVGTSTILVQSWEQGKRKPNRMACRLLEEIERDPSHWLAKLQRGSAA
jgi:putative transcriptional regulator